MYNEVSICLLTFLTPSFRPVKPFLQIIICVLSLQIALQTKWQTTKGDRLKSGDGLNKECYMWLKAILLFMGKVMQII